MNIKHLFFSLFCILCILACTSKIHLNHTNIPDATIKEMGIECASTYMEFNKVKEEKSEVTHAEHIKFYFNNVTGLKKVNQKVFPAISIIVQNKVGDTLLQESNLLTSISKSGTNLNPLKLEAFFICGFPSSNTDNDEFTVKITISDLKGPGKYSLSKTFRTVENKNLQITQSGLTFSECYMWNDNQQVAHTNGKVNVNDKLMAILEGIEGMTEVNGNVFPIVELILKDNTGKEIIHNPNILEEYSATGVSPEILKSQLMGSVQVGNALFKNPLTLTMTITDAHSTKNIVLKTRFETQK